jgi:hypothetical protein
MLTRAGYERITEEEVRITFGILCRLLGWSMDEYQLDRWRPGDGVDRYQVTRYGGSVEPLGSRLWFGAREAEVAMLAIIHATWHQEDRRTAAVAASEADAR